MSGPRISADCHTCDHVVTERYRVQGDSGHDVSCSHPSIGRREIGDTRWNTPDWCPLLIEAAEQYLVQLRARKEAT